MANPTGINQYSKSGARKAAVLKKKHAARLDAAYNKLEKQGASPRTKGQLKQAKSVAWGSRFAR